MFCIVAVLRLHVLYCESVKSTCFVIESVTRKKVWRSVLDDGIQFVQRLYFVSFAIFLDRRQSCIVSIVTDYGLDDSDIWTPGGAKIFLSFKTSRAAVGHKQHPNKEVVGFPLGVNEPGREAGDLPPLVPRLWMSGDIYIATHPMCLRQPTLPLSIRINTGSLYRNVSVLNYKRDKDNVS